MNLSGTLKSIQQGMTNTKIPFARTPKVNNRTASPALYVTMPWVIIIYSCMVFYADTFSHNWGNAVFAGFNAVVTFWALTAYIGTYLALTALESRWWGEGEVKMYIDGDDQYPTWCSTGAEDYFGGAWSFADFDEHGRMHEQTFCAPYVGFPFYSQRLASHRESAYWDVNTPVTRGLYRWHIPDPIYFEHDLRVEWQQIGTEEGGNFERQDDVASVAYWYQLEPHTPFTPIGDRRFRQPR